MAKHNGFQAQRSLWTGAASLAALLVTLALSLSCQLHRDRQHQPLTHKLVHLAIAAFVTAPPPPRNTNISVDWPLFFLHQRKAGGSSMRVALHAAAQAANLSTFIPCLSTPCPTFTIGDATAAVYAGHFPWRDLAHRYGAVYANNSQTVLDGSRGYETRYRASCTTLFRDPVSRLESCYYYRIVRQQLYSDERFTCLSNLSTDEVRDVFISARAQNPGWGCGNEPFRILSGLVDKMDIHAMSTSPPGSPTFNSAIGLALAHLANCVPLVLEDPRSMRLAQHWFPQLSAAFEPEALPHENKGSQRCPLSGSTRAVLEELTLAERMLYNAARRRVEIMLALLPPRGGSSRAESTIISSPLG